MDGTPTVLQTSSSHTLQQLEDPAAAKIATEEDDCLRSINFPASHLKRLARAACPSGTRFSSEAIAGLQRVAQAYVLWATDRSLVEARGDNEKKQKGKTSASTGGRRLSIEHVMRFLTTELPPIAKQVAVLLPDVMPEEFKPPAVLLLEQLREQTAKREAAMQAPQTVPDIEPNQAAAPPAAPAVQTATKRLRQVEQVDQEEAGAVQSTKKAKLGRTPALSNFFGKPVPLSSSPKANEAAAKEEAYSSATTSEPIDDLPVAGPASVATVNVDQVQGMACEPAVGADEVEVAGAATMPPGVESAKESENSLDNSVNLTLELEAVLSEANES